MPVPILKQGPILIASVQAALTDSDTERLRYDLMERVSRFRAQGIIVDVTAIDVMDSFAARSLRTIAHMTRLRGADTVIVGLQPEVAFAMVQLGLVFDDMHTALDLEEGLALLNRRLAPRKRRSDVTVADDVVVDVGHPDDIVAARQAGHQLARRPGFLADRCHDDRHCDLGDRPQHHQLCRLRGDPGRPEVREGRKLWWCGPKTTVRASPTSTEQWKTAIRPAAAWALACPAPAG